MAIIAMGLVILLVAADQLIKWAVVANIPLGDSVTVIPGLLNWQYIQNRGAAFGLFQNQRWIFIVLTSLLVIAAIVFMFTKYCNHKLLIASLILIIAGGVGNLIDRIFLGYVVDFISFSFFPPIFNFADSCVCVGAVMLAVYILFFDSKQKIVGSDLKSE